MKQYLDLLKDIKENGDDRMDRTGVGTRSIFGRQLRFDLRKGFPLLTTKKVHMKSVIYELLWFIKGDTNIKYLQDHGVTIWNEWRRPYFYDRRMVLVEKKNKDYVPYDGEPPIRYSASGMSEEDQKLAHAWSRMMNRCYNKKDDKYRSYGAKGTSVCKRWHNVKNYIEDVKKLPHWYYKKNDWNSFELDKDYYKANQYGPDTCVWLHKTENVPKEWIMTINPDGEIGYFDSINATARSLGLASSSVCRFAKSGGRVINAKQSNKKVLGWRFTKISEDSSEMLLRRSLIEDGDLGEIYGAQWRRWEGKDGVLYDQLAEVINTIKTNPTSRRMLVNAWNVGELKNMALPPCHMMYQFHVSNGRLSCQLYQRSCDVFLGLPFNIASYALLTHMVADVCGLEVGEFIWTGGDIHLYHNHFEQADLQLSREPLELPTLKLNHRNTIDEFVYEDIEIEGYKSHARIPAPIAV